MGFRKRRCVDISLLLCLLLPGMAEAQVRILGRVIEDQTLEPISYAEVAFLTADGVTIGRTEADRLGNFEFLARRVSAVQIKAKRLGYQETTTPILHFDDRQLFKVEVRLDPAAILLAPLEIVAWADVIQNALHEGFWRRVGNGFGHYITSEEVEARNPSKVTDLLRDLPGITISGGGVGNRPTVRMARAANRNCATQIWVDGFLVNRRIFGPGGANPADFRIDDMVSPVSVEGIEIYPGPSTVPPEFLNMDADCGVIAIWTKRGGAG